MLFGACTFLSIDQTKAGLKIREKPHRIYFDCQRPGCEGICGGYVGVQFQWLAALVSGRMTVELW